MTLAAPRSRQGRAFLALAFLAAMVAVVGGFLWATQAHADLPTTTLTYTQSPTGPATVNPGTLVTYTITLQTTGTNSSGAVVLTAAVDADLKLTTVTCSTPAGGVAWTASGAGTATLVCTSAAATTNINPETMTVTGNVHGNISVPTVTVHDGAGATITAANTGAGVGALTLGAGATVTDATNFPGIAHTFVFTLDPGVT